MNPPSALAGAMSRERKPFTYTPGGLDLSEIKSERMAQRLMRNAMNQGVPETPPHAIQSPPPLSMPVVMPNYNCLPVQVFPTFQLPANPKTLLRTRSNPDPYDKLLGKSSDLNTVSNNTLPRKHSYNETPTNYGSTAKTQLVERNDSEFIQNTLNKQTNPDAVIPKTYESMRPVYFDAIPERPTITDYKSINETNTVPLVDIDQTYTKKEETKVLNEKSTSEESTDNRNGDTNTAITLKLPIKKSEAKTETKVEVVKNTLPDGSIQEVKTTTTTTTIDGRTEITTEKETTTYPKCDDEDVEYEIVEEEEEETNKTEVIHQNEIDQNINTNKHEALLNGKEEENEDESKEHEVVLSKKDGQIITEQEKHESSTTKKVVIIQSETQSDEENEEEYEEIDEPDNVESEEIVTVKNITEDTEKQEIQDKDVVNNSKDNVNDEVVEKESALLQQNASDEIEENSEEVEEEEEEETAVEEKTVKKEIENTLEPKKQADIDEDEEVEEEYEEAEEAEEIEKPEEVEKTETAKEECNTNDKSPQLDLNQTEKIEPEQSSNDIKDNCIDKVKEIPIKIETETVHNTNSKEQEEIKKNEHEPVPTVPLDKVEEIEIKPIGPAKEVITKTHTEIITKTTDKPVGSTSTQTEYNIIENIVTVNRTTKTLDHAYEEIPDNVSSIKTFTPPTLDRNLISPQPIFRSYQPFSTPEDNTERRHSLLLERISVERQMPSDIYQSNYQTYNQTYEDQKHYPQEPQSEILIVNNVKPSTVSKNQQWYQRSEADNVTSSSSVPSDSYSSQQNFQTQFKPQTQQPLFNQPKPQTQSAYQTLYQPQPRIQPSPQPTYQPPPQQSHQPVYQPKPQTQPTYQPQPQMHPPTQPTYQTPVQETAPLYHPQPQYQQNYVDNTMQETYKSSKNQYEQTSYPSYNSKPVWNSSLDSQPLTSSQPNQYSHQKDYSESYQKSSQHSSYVPPPWEQDPNYVVDNSTQNYYQPPPLNTAFPSNEWKPTKSAPKFPKPAPKAYIPPAPNQSFVKPVIIEPPKQKGRKTYYSEYERRYISVPEATYIPNETKFQAQPDPSPQYYYDNNETTEVVEPQWRKELREFKEQTSKTTIHTEHTSVRPPWEDDPKYAAPKDFTPTPTWTQTLNPRSWRERSYEPEYIGSQEWPKTNTLGRGRPQSSYVKSNFDRAPDRTRGVSVDRYNPNNYQSPLTREHPPPASHILDPIVQGQTYHNPNVPAYHSRASVEPREQPVTYQQPRHRESRAPPVQSRSFKYLQWITGTDD